MSEQNTKRRWVRAHCYSCDWDGYTDNLDDACYSCGEYESLKEIPGDENAGVNHDDFCRPATDEEISTMFD